MNDSFFGKSGTMQDALGMANMLRSSQSGNSIDRLSGLGALVQFVMSLFG